MFSIIMPIWNRSRVIGRALESILKQTYKDYELLIVDDSSDDDAYQRIKPFFSSNIRFFRLGNRGAFQARNGRLQNASGSYITYLDPVNWDAVVKLICGRSKKRKTRRSIVNVERVA